MKIFALNPNQSVCSFRHAIAVQRVHLLSKQRRISVPQRPLQKRESTICLAFSTPVYELAESGNLLSTLFVGSVSLAIAVNIAISSLPLLTGASKPPSAKKEDVEDQDDVKWGVMSVISFIPLLNWLV